MDSYVWQQHSTFSFHTHYVHTLVVPRNQNLPSLDWLLIPTPVHRTYDKGHTYKATPTIATETMRVIFKL